MTPARTTAQPCRASPAATERRTRSDSHGDIEWLESRAPVPYATAVRCMEQRVDAILTGRAAEAVWLLEHPPLYTAGTSASDDELLDAARFPVFRAGRGGRYTYHGPGQRVAYVMLDLRRRGADVRGFVCALEGWIIEALARFGVEARRAPGRIGVWVDLPTGDGGAAAGEAKIAAVGVRVRRWVSWHGIAINVAPDLTHFAGIVPCGIAEYPVTSLAALGLPVALADVDAALKQAFTRAFPG